MSIEEFSWRFDVLYNSITSNQAPGLDELEKSMFLTKAQDEIVKNHFTAESKGNTLGKGFDGNQKRQADFSMLMTSKRLQQSTSITDEDHFDPRSLAFEWPEKIFIMINEQLVFKSDTENVMRQVIPLTFDDYTRLMSKPYKQPLKNQAWRLLTGSSVEKVDNPNSETASMEDVPTKVAEIIVTSPDYTKYCKTNSGYTTYYNLRYIKEPNPIILVDLDEYSGNQLSINGKNEASECELDPILHEEILQRAVELAKTAWLATDANGMQLETTMGQRSE